MSTIPFYASLERQGQFLTEARSWLGTPFSENCAIKGKQGGISCRHYVTLVHINCDALPSVALVDYPVEVVRHYHEHHTQSLILAALAKPELSGRVRRIDDGDAPMVGDIAVLRFAQTEHHMGLWCGAEILHVSTSAGVIRHSTCHPEVQKALRCCYRIYEP